MPNVVSDLRKILQYLFRLSCTATYAKYNHDRGVAFFQIAAAIIICIFN
jgi:hypothetical protein